MQISDPVTPPAAQNIVGPVPTLPVPGVVSFFGPDVTAHIAVTGLVYCTAVFLYDAASGARGMMHYNPEVGPKQATFDWFVRYMKDKYNAQIASLTVALFNNTSSSRGNREFHEGIYKTDRIKGFLEHAFGPLHGGIAATRYKFKGSIGLMDANGQVTGCVGPEIEDVDKVRAKRMNWLFAKPNKGLGSQNILGSHRED